MSEMRFDIPSLHAAYAAGASAADRRSNIRTLVPADAAAIAAVVAESKCTVTPPADVSAILPLVVSGSASTKTTCRGRLNAAMHVPDAAGETAICAAAEPCSRR